MDNSLLALPGRESKSGKIAKLLPAVLFFGLLFYFSNPSFQQGENNRMKMEKSSGRNGKHANPKARQSAEEQYQKAKEAWQQIKSRANKSPEDKKLQQELEKQVKHWEKKKGWKGDHHSQKHKGN